MGVAEDYWTDVRRALSESGAGPVGLVSILRFEDELVYATCDVSSENGKMHGAYWIAYYSPASCSVRVEHYPFNTREEALKIVAKLNVTPAFEPEDRARDLMPQIPAEPFIGPRLYPPDARIWEFHKGMLTEGELRGELAEMAEQGMEPHAFYLDLFHAELEEEQRRWPAADEPLPYP